MTKPSEPVRAQEALALFIKWLNTHPQENYWLAEWLDTNGEMISFEVSLADQFEEEEPA